MYSRMRHDEKFKGFDCNAGNTRQSEPNFYEVYQVSGFVQEWSAPKTGVFPIIMAIIVGTATYEQTHASEVNIRPASQDNRHRKFQRLASRQTGQQSVVDCHTSQPIFQQKRPNYHAHNGCKWLPQATDIGRISILTVIVCLSFK